MKRPALLLLPLLLSLIAAAPATRPATRPAATQAAKPIPKTQLTTFLGGLPSELRPKENETGRTSADRAKWFERNGAGKRLLASVVVIAGGTPLQAKGKLTSLAAHVEGLPGWLAFDKQGAILLGGTGVDVECAFSEDPSARDVYPDDKAVIEGDFKEVRLTSIGRPDGRCTGTVTLVNCKLVSVTPAKPH